MKLLALLVVISALPGCQTLVPIAVRCEPPPALSEACIDPNDQLLADAKNASTIEATSEHLIAYAAEAKKKFISCKDKHQSLLTLMEKCNQIVDRTVEAIEVRQKK